MKRYIKKVFLFVGIIILLLLCFFFTDFLLVKNMKQPIFYKTGKQYWDGGSYECYGTFYKVIVYKNVHGKVVHEEIGPYHLKFDKNKMNSINN